MDSQGKRQDQLESSYMAVAVCILLTIIVMLWIVLI